MATSRRQAILETFKSRLEGIHVVDGFNTDAGDAVHLGETPTFGPGDAPTALAVIPGEDTVTKQGTQLLIGLPIEIHILARADLDAPWVAVEQMLADVKTAIEVEDELLQSNSKNDLIRGSTRTLEREPGSDSVGAVIAYAFAYGERWGHP